MVAGFGFAHTNSVPSAVPEESTKRNNVYGRDSLQVDYAGNRYFAHNYSYDSGSGRLSAVSSGDFSATYEYLPNSDLLRTTTCKSNNFTALTTTRAWDYGYRLSAIVNQTNGGGAVTSHSYTYDSADRRIRAALEDGSVWVCDYNNRNELTGARRFWQDWAPVSGQFFGYDYDSIGNRKSAWAGGDVNGANLRPISYTANSLNQYTAISNPGYEQVVGAALATNPVTVNSAPADRKSEYFHREISIANGAGPSWTDVNVTSATATTTGGIISPGTSQTLVYDADGNLTFDGLWAYEWDAENRLIGMSMTNVAAGSLPDAKRYRLDFAYDYLGRRISKTVSHWNGSTFVDPVTTLLVYDGWNLLAEFRTPDSPVRTYMWGQDLSGTTDRAGGIGGLILLTLAGPQYTNAFVTYDGNGNVTGVMDSSTFTELARYEFSPFGQILRSSGPAAHANPLRFVTRFSDDETGLVCFPRRPYSPAMGRWLTRDPLAENGGRNLYGFTRNNPCNRFDPLGLSAPDIVEDIEAAYALQAAEYAIVDYAMGDGWSADQDRRWNSLMHPNEGFTMGGVEVGVGPGKVEAMGFLGKGAGRLLYGGLMAFGGWLSYGPEWNNQEGWTGVALLDPGAGYGIYEGTAGDTGGFTYIWIGVPGFELFIGFGGGWAGR